MRIFNFSLVLLIVVAGVGFGIVFEQEKFPPYFYAKEKYLKSEAAIRKLLGRPPQNSARDASSGPSKTIAVRQIHSALLPLEIRGLQLDAYFDVPTEAGGIATIDNRVLIADRKANFYLSRDGGRTVERLTLPRVPDNIDKFFEWGVYGRSGLFRLHDIEFIESSGKLFLLAAHEYFDSNLGATRLALSRIEVEHSSFAPSGDWERIFESTPLKPQKTYYANGAGGRIAVKNDHTVVVTIGDYNQDGVFLPFDGVAPAQDPSQDFGTIVEIDVVSGAKTRLSYGHRNPQGLMVSSSGRILSTEHGPRGGDELNVIVADKNYGWPAVTLGLDYPAYAWPGGAEPGRHGNYELPLFSWVPSIAVSNLIEIKRFNPRWDGDLLVSSLKAQSLYRLRMEDGRIVYSEPIWIGQRIRDIAQLSNGTIVLWTDDTQLLFVTVDDDILVKNTFGGIQATTRELGSCLKCHHIGLTTPEHPAPTLSNIFGKSIAVDPNFDNYTSALKQLGGEWTRSRLTQYLSSPSDFAPGTSMVIEPIDDLAKIRKIIDELEKTN